MMENIAHAPLVDAIRITSKYHLAQSLGRCFISSIRVHFTVIGNDSISKMIRFLSLSLHNYGCPGT